ncbi:hypothetical protein RM780_18495 [Streptomyces sp. DSM 44917]|uniref:Leucine-rich repeat domain-containing protein n=1 Tax=Streptomyces boetiae TaxID=3075541 RepID=A0ABU2LBT1_9ACTN|nr:hypothetical protein [Streptomyces sp. DSM 44917]MDT0308936.1 hypothetical protein [Streptomyces sp. DSM 44917]
MDAGSAGLRIASGLVAPLVKRLFQRDDPGPALVDKPIRIAALPHAFRDSGQPHPRGLRHLTGLERLSLGREVKLDSLEDLPTGAALTSLSLPALPPRLTDIGVWPTLTHLGINPDSRPLSPSEWRAIAALPALTSITPSPHTLGDMLSTGLRLPGVGQRDLRGEPSERILRLLVSALPSLREVILDSAPEGIGPLSQLPRPERLHVY